MTERNPACEWVLERLDAFIDGETGEAESAAIRAHCRVCANCARELELAIRVRRELRALPQFPAPARVVDAARRALDESKVVPLHERRRTRSIRAAAVIAAAFTLVAAIVWTGVRERAAREEEAQVRRATAELALAFSYVGHYSEQATGKVIEERVLPPIKRAMSTSRDSAKPDVTSPPPDRS